MKSIGHELVEEESARTLGVLCWYHPDSKARVLGFSARFGLERLLESPCFAVRKQAEHTLSLLGWPQVPVTGEQGAVQPRSTRVVSGLYGCGY